MKLIEHFKFLLFGTADNCLWLQNIVSERFPISLIQEIQ